MAQDLGPPGAVLRGLVTTGILDPRPVPADRVSLENALQISLFARSGVCPRASDYRQDA